MYLGPFKVITTWSETIFKKMSKNLFKEENGEKCLSFENVGAV